MKRNFVVVSAQTAFRSDALFYLRRVRHLNLDLADPIGHRVKTRSYTAERDFTAGASHILCPRLFLGYASHASSGSI